MEVGEKKVTTQILKKRRQTLSRLTAQFTEFGDGVVLVPGTLSLIFDSAVSGHANNVYREQCHKSSC